MSDDAIPTSKTHSDDLKRPAERFGSYHNAARPLFNAEPLVERGSEDAWCNVWLVDDLAFGRAGFTRTMFRRSPQQASKGSGFLLQFYNGKQLGEVKGSAFRLDAQRLVLQDLAHPYTAVAHADEILSAFIPRHRLEAHEWLYRRAIVAWDIATPQGQILLYALRTIIDQLPRLRQSETAAVVEGFVGLLNGLLLAEPGARKGTPVEGVRLEAMKAYLLRHLHDPDLSPDSLSKNFGCSRAKIYRLFEQDGGVASFLRNQRLLRCFTDLGRAKPGNATVQQIARRWGFTDPYHFSRLFKRTFGAPPSDILHCAPRAAGATEAPKHQKGGSAVIHDWVKAFSPRP
jgi:AraC-like DNA-binding protein